MRSVTCLRFVLMSRTSQWLPDDLEQTVQARREENTVICLISTQIASHTSLTQCFACRDEKETMWNLLTQLKHYTGSNRSVIFVREKSPSRSMVLE